MPRSLDVLQLRARLGDNLLAQGRRADAVAELEPAHRALSNRHPDAWVTSEARSLLGAALAADKPSARAERLLTDGYEGLQRHAAEDPRIRIGRTLQPLFAWTCT